MKGALFFISFFLIFAIAVYIIPTPMFPGDFILNLANASALPQATFLSAVINGITYGLIAWAVFAAAMRRMGDSESRKPAQNQVKAESGVKSRGRRSRKTRRY